VIYISTCTRVKLSDVEVTVRLLIAAIIQKFIKDRSWNLIDHSFRRKAEDWIGGSDS
jgi:hypothetical protein